MKFDNSTRVVVSLTTIPPRFNDVYRTILSLQNQSRKPDAIELTIPRVYRRFPQHAFRLPSVPEGTSVEIVERDLGPASKVLPCALRYRGQNVRIVYCDDDRSAPRDWLSSLLDKTLEHPDKAIVASGSDLDRMGVGSPAVRDLPRAQRRRSRVDLVYRAKRIRQIFQGLLVGEKLPKPGRNPFRTDGYVDIAEGLGGVSVAPSFFDDLCHHIPDVIWTVDDIWLSGSLARRGIGIWAGSACKVPDEHRGTNLSALASSIIEGADRHEANIRCIRYMQDTFGIWK